MSVEDGAAAGALFPGLSTQAEPPYLPGLEAVSPIGSGGSATVWRCFQLRFERWVAVKVVDTRLNSRAEAWFARECAALGGLSGHPYIVPVYDGGLDESGRPYLVMPYVESGSLADLLQRAGPLDWQRVLEIGVKVCGALQAAHEVGILHRDVKPENILLDRFGEPQLADFGVARVVGSATLSTKSIRATPVHAAPEVLDGLPASASSDVYGLASSLYRLAAGSPAFILDSDESLLPLLVRVATEEPASLTQFGLPAAAADAIAAGMARATTARPSSALEFAQLLQQAQQALGLPVTRLPGYLSEQGAPSGPVRNANPGELRRSPASTPTPPGRVRSRPSPASGVIPPAAAPPATRIQGRRCSAGHLNPPSEVRCRWCQAPVDTARPALGDRPSLGVLRLSNGEVVHLDRGVIIGRSPRVELDEAGPLPHVVRVPSADGDISRSHVAVRLDGWDVQVIDLRSTNGTVMTMPGREPRQLPAGRPVLIPPGTLVSLADDVSFRYEVVE